jgi:RNA polymerase sigma-70 factor (family 1)
MVSSGRSDDELLALLRNGDDKAFAELFDRYWKPLLFVAGKKLGSLDEAEDVVQELFVSIWSRRERLEINTSLGGYLATSTKYMVSRVLASRASKSQLDEQITEKVIERDLPNHQVEFNQLESQLNNIVANLPEKCRLVYELSRESGYSHKQISETLVISEKTVESHINKALKAIRRGISSYFFFLL